jgi:hypothetical protein
LFKEALSCSKEAQSCSKEAQSCSKRAQCCSKEAQKLNYFFLKKIFPWDSVPMHSGRFEEKIRIKSDFQVSISSEIFW